MSAFLGVESSLTGKRWRLRGGDDRAGLMLSQRLGLPELVGRIMAARGICLDDADSFLAPRLRTQLPDPAVLRDMDRAAERLAAAVIDGEQIAVFGDYDVDGATSSAVLARFFAAVGAPLRIYIPDRLTEGYGPNAPALLRLRAEGAKVIVTVDCGITAFEPLAAAQEAGLDLIVIDHHAAEPSLPAGYAIVNPNRLDEDRSLGHLAAVGVSFLLAVAVNRHLRAAGWYKSRQEPDLLALTDLVALGTVCDVVSLTGLNRAFVTQGLRVMARRANIGLAALCDVAGLHEPPNAYHLGYILGPRVNAGGRVGQSDLGARLLTARDRGEAHAMAQQLDAFNAERREIEAAVLQEATEQAFSERQGDPLVMVAGHAWHPGVIGIVASRIKDRTDRPSIVVSLEDGVGKGSGRSVSGVDLGAAIIAARQAGLLINGGGHPMAAGLTVDADRVDDLRHFLCERVEREIAEKQIVPTLHIDGAMRPAALNPDLLDDLERLAPFGSGNPEPRFALQAAQVAKADVVGDGHVRCFLTDTTGARLPAIAFKTADTPLGEALRQSNGRPLHLTGKLRSNHWQGQRNAQFTLDDGVFA